MEIMSDFDFSKKEVIGHGAFAMVYKGHFRKDPSRTVALKSILKKNLAKSPNLLGKEIKILKELTELHHENVVALFDCKETATNVYLVMEYCNGGDLADYLHEKHTLSEDTIRLFLIQLAGAMEALFAKGIVHRDLKPQNILLAHKGQVRPPPSEIRLKIADFGFARFLEDGVMAATLCGSPMYMAPEVIMSLKYDAKADLWSLGTIVFQCLTGKAPFQAQSPQELKVFYEKHINLSPRIPTGTSPDLTDLLTGLLKRNACERMNFETFFNHKFLKRVSVPPPRVSVPPPQSPLVAGTQYLISTLTSFGSPPSLPKLPARPSTPVKKASPVISQPESPRSTRNALSSSPEDDYVIVSQNMQLDLSSESANEREKPKLKVPIRTSPMPYVPMISPTRPSFLPISEPIPVPTQRAAFEKMYNQAEKKEESNSLAKSSSIPRSQPINMKKRPERQKSDIDISSMSPPTVQFVIGTPPGGRRRSTSGSLCETPPPPSFWTVSPVTAAKTMPMNSPLRRSGTSPPVLTGPLAKVPILSSPNLGDNNNLGKSPIIPFGTRAVTLPEISEMGNYPTFATHTSTWEPQPITFMAPELAEETILEKEHNETLAKINFVLALSNCILELASQRSTPLAALVDPSQQMLMVNEQTRRVEQIVLLVRALQLMSSGLDLAAKQLKSGQLRASSTVKTVISTLNSKFRKALTEVKQLHTPALMQKVVQLCINAEKILYEHALQMCQSAALDELFEKPEECFQKYQTAQILFHSLSQQVHHQQDKMILKKYKDAVETRLYLLQQQGYIYATDINN